MALSELTWTVVHALVMSKSVKLSASVGLSVKWDISAYFVGVIIRMK